VKTYLTLRTHKVRDVGASCWMSIEKI